MLTGDYRPFKEDRLTQLTAASFNQSKIFRGCLLDFLGVRNAKRIANATAKTQISAQHHGDLGRLDLQIIRGDRVVAIIENKVDSALYPGQLNFYSRDPDLESAKKIALVKHYFNMEGSIGNWVVLHWRDFYLALCKRLDSKQSIPALDGFIINNFKQYLEASHMHIPTEISKKDMNELARMLYCIRYPQKNKYHGIHPKGPVFETAADWVRIMESIFEESRLVSKLTKAARKKYRFNPCVSHWKDEEPGEKNYRWLAIHAKIPFAKPRGKTRSVGMGLFVEDNGKWQVVVFRNVVGSERLDEKKIIDGRGNVQYAALSKMVLAQWKKWLP